jgi:hypothetical protein
MPSTPLPGTTRNLVVNMEKLNSSWKAAARPTFAANPVAALSGWAQGKAKSPAKHALIELLETIKGSAGAGLLNAQLKGHAMNVHLLPGGNAEPNVRNPFYHAVYAMVLPYVDMMVEGKKMTYAEHKEFAQALTEKYIAFRNAYDSLPADVKSKPDMKKLFSITADGTKTGLVEEAFAKIYENNTTTAVAIKMANQRVRNATQNAKNKAESAAARASAAATVASIQARMNALKAHGGRRKTRRLNRSRRN